MIAKVEAVIRRALASVWPQIYDWIIVDRGSVDSAQVTVRDYPHEKKGELEECSWIYLVHYRTEVLVLARRRIAADRV